MKIAEALIRRADFNKKLAEVKNRLSQNAVVQEDDRPAFEPVKLMREMDSLILNLKELVRNINRSNSKYAFNDELSISDAIAEKDAIRIKINILQSFLDANAVRFDRYSRSEIKVRGTYEPEVLRKEIDDLSRDLRELDIKLQELNWKYDLIE
ncbi:MAG: hypothetical protein EHM58_11135 [Ignavibacteriae bacterium]|nr:MAG: hypothetical protein EHM58_11135 [Ignavibacteriota bacterium]